MRFEEFSEICPRGLGSPSVDDYQIYMIVNFIKSLSMVNESLLNKSLSYIKVYYSLVDLLFENKCTL